MSERHAVFNLQKTNKTKATPYHCKNLTSIKLRDLRTNSKLQLVTTTEKSQKSKTTIINDWYIDKNVYY